MKSMVLLLFFFVPMAFAENWICEEAASMRQGNTFLVCGVGTSELEQDARLDAIKNAKREFEEICSVSSDCRGHRLRVEPLRNDCRGFGQKIKCYRAFRYEIGTEEDPDSFLEQQNALLDEEIAATQKKLNRLNAVRDKEKRLKEMQYEMATGVKAAPKNQRDTSNILVGGDVLLSSPVFHPEGIGGILAAMLQYRISDSIALEAGGGVDGYLVIGRIYPGFSYHVALPLYLKEYPTKSVLFLGPEYHGFSHDGEHKKFTTGAAGLRFGWQEMPTPSNSAVRFYGGALVPFQAQDAKEVIIYGAAGVFFGL